MEYNNLESNFFKLGQDASNSISLSKLHILPALLIHYNKLWKAQIDTMVILLQIILSFSRKTNFPN